MINYCKRLSFTCRLFYTSSAINASTVSFSSRSSAARVHGENDSLHPTPPLLLVDGIYDDAICGNATFVRTYVEQIN